MSVGAPNATEVKVVTRGTPDASQKHGPGMRARVTDPRLAAPVLIAVILAGVAVAASASRAGAIAGRQSGPEIRAAVICGAVVLILLAGVIFFCDRALVASETAEELADRVSESERHREEGQRLAGIGSWEWDFENRSYLCSKEQLRLHGWDTPESLNTVDALLAAIDPADRDRVRAEIVREFEPGETISLDYRVPFPDGKRLIHLEAKVIEGPAGAPSGLIGTCLDVSERLRRLEAERANRAKSEFMSRMSHELRTPLNAILGFAQLLAGEVDGQRRDRNVKRILDAGEQLLGLINELLEISRLDNGRLELSSEPRLLNELLAEAVDRTRSEAWSKGIEIRAELGAQEIWVDVDPQRLTQVVVRLLSNAVRYNRDGGHVELRVSTAGDQATVVVSDDGPGVPAEKLGQLFQPFERLGAEQSGVQGAGLGLALSEGIIEAMGGSIEFESDARGTTVTIMLRRLDRVAPSSLPSAAVSDSDQPAVVLGFDEKPPDLTSAPSDLGPRAVVLCIDDNPSNLILIEHILAARPAVEVLSADRGLRGLELASSRLPALILLDLNLPDIDGRDLLARLKADGALCDIPVVMLSADAAPERHSALIGAGASAYLTKPIDVAELLMLVDQLLAIRKGPSP
jgi:signal transduction histidine kinase/CheY-like chemotaxis protein